MKKARYFDGFVLLGAANIAGINNIAGKSGFDLGAITKTDGLTPGQRTKLGVAYLDGIPHGVI